MAQVVSADAATLTQVEFMVLSDGRIHFQGSAAALLASPDPYLREYLLLTLPGRPPLARVVLG